MPEQPIEQPSYVHVKSVHGGMVDRLEPWLLDQFQSALLQNLDVSTPGSRRRARGVSSIGGRTDSPLGVWRAFDSTLNQESLWGAWGGRAFICPGAGVVNQRGCGVSLTSTLHMFTAGRYQARAATYITTAGPDDSNASLASLLAVITDNDLYTQVASIAPQCATWFQNRLWIGYNLRNQDDQTVWWSELNDGTLFSNVNALRPESGLGGRVTALLGIRGFTPTVVTFKQRAIAVIEPFWGTSSKLIPAAADALDTIKTSIRPISLNVGCAAAKSVQFVPGAPDGDVFFLAEDGIRVLRRATDDTISGVTEPISLPIRDTIARINFSYAHKCTSAFVDRHYRLAVPLDGATECTHILSYDVDNKGWSIRTWRAKDMVNARANNEQAERLWFQGNTATGDCSNTSVTAAFHLFEAFTGLLDPSGVPVIYQEDTRAFDFGDMTAKKRWDQAVFVVRNDSVVTATFGVMCDVDGAGFITAASFSFGGSVTDPIMGQTPLPWGSTPGLVRVFRLSLADLPAGYFLQLRILGHSDLGDPTIHSVSVGARPVYQEFDNSIA